MNDREHNPDLPDRPATAPPVSATGTPPSVSVTLGDIRARRDTIAGEILRPNPSARASVSAIVGLFRDEIARALDEGKKWGEIAASLSTSGVVARPDAVRMAYRRLPQRTSQRSPSTLSVVTAPLPTPSRHPDEMRSTAAPSDKPPSLARRVR